VEEPHGTAVRIGSLRILKTRLQPEIFKSLNKTISENEIFQMQK
jgi:hypothetical protein